MGITEYSDTVIPAPCNSRFFRLDMRVQNIEGNGDRSSPLRNIATTRKSQSELYIDEAAFNKFPVEEQVGDIGNQREI